VSNCNDPYAIRKIKVKNVKGKAAKEKLASSMFVYRPPCWCIVDLRNPMKHLPFEIQPKADLAFFIKTYRMIQFGFSIRMEKYRNQ
jgi:hypothetical protein